MPARPNKPQIGVVGVGDYALQIGDPAGIAIDRNEAPSGADSNSLAELSHALSEEPQPAERGAGPTEAAAGLVDEASAITGKVEQAVALGKGLSAGEELDPAQLGLELNVALNLLEKLDRDGRWKEELRLARALGDLYGLLRRWSALLRSLRALLRAGEALGDLRAVGLAKHQLGTLEAIAGDVGGAARNLGEAREIRRQVGSAREVEVTDRSLRGLCRRMNGGSFKSGRRSILRISAPLAVLAALLLFFAGGIAGGVVGRQTRGGGNATNGEKVGQVGPEGKVLEIELEGSGSGTVHSKPAGIECPPDCAEAFRQKQAVTLTAEPDRGSTFNRFSGGCTGESPCELRVDGPTSVAAAFTATPILTIKIAGNGGVQARVEGAKRALSCHVAENEVTEDEERIPQAGDSCEEPFPIDSVVALTIDADKGWRLDPESPQGCKGIEPCVVTMSEPRIVNVRFSASG